ncbi:putative sporulation transcription factor Spo0A [Clostridiales bacterium oral taxon 876 str. F0540]|nr:putative sporulation transcription factor Spo0A [Clostridiales bacterium oral taxon 876 str. F0540]
MKNGKLDVLLVDDNRDLDYLIKEYLERSEDLNIVGIATDGNQALELIQETKPDCVVLDIIMPKLDGLEVLDKINEIDLPYHPKTIILSIINQDSIIQKAFEEGADYYLVKPVSLELLEKKIRQTCLCEEHDILTSRLKNYKEAIELDKEEEITNLLRIIGMPFNIKGYRFVKDAILMVLEDRELLSSITTVLYPHIAEMHNTTSSRVERAIRHAIETTWLRGNMEELQNIFGDFSKFHKSRPTNSEFIAILAEKLKFEFK